MSKTDTYLTLSNTKAAAIKATAALNAAVATRLMSVSQHTA
ncbi:MAG: hypothetical protein ABFS03_08995 [Chloroflexota bacterium]